MLLFTSTNRLRTWIVDSIYRADAGLFEIEQEYRKKFPRSWKKKLSIDRNHNQLEGKFTYAITLAQDFNVPIPVTGDRIMKRVKLRGAKMSKIPYVKPF